MKEKLEDIFIFELQKDLKMKILKNDPALRVIAIPSIPKFFVYPITVKKALKIYEDYKKI